MSGKSRHRRGRYTVQGKKKKGKRSPPAMISQQPVDTQIERDFVAPPELTAPSLSASTITPATLKYPHLNYELRKIGILAGITLATLMILSLVLG
jgi:hypothetical protein